VNRRRFDVLKTLYAVAGLMAVIVLLELFLPAMDLASISPESNQAASQGSRGVTTDSQAGSSLPGLVAPVNDFANVIDADSERTIDRSIRSLAARSGNVIVVATLKTCKAFSDIRECSLKLFGNQGKGIGQRGKDNGVLLLLAVDDRQVRITTGLGMEQIITNQRAAEIVRAMTPDLAKGEYSAGLLKGIELLVSDIEPVRPPC
jgi:uncharacterized protein